MSLPIHIYSLSLDSMPFLPKQLEIFERLERPWTWHIVSGVADTVACTSWCAKTQPRLSRDGSDEWLTAHLKHPNMRIYRRQLWPGKNAMVNAALSQIKEPCCLMEIDADEFYAAEQLEKIVAIYEAGQYDQMRFFCRYFVGKNIICTNTTGWSNRGEVEWARSWYFKPGMMQKSHEPPILGGCGNRIMTREQTRKMGLVFDHFSWVLESNVLAKLRYYKYGEQHLNGWRRLQANTQWPISDLKAFLPWVGNGVTADLFENVYPNEINPASKFIQ